MVGTLVFGEICRNTHIRFRNIDDYETYIISFDDGYDSQELFSMVIFVN